MGLIARFSGVAAVAVVLLGGAPATAAPGGDGLSLTVHAARTAFPPAIRSA